MSNSNMTLKNTITTITMSDGTVLPVTGMTAQPTIATSGYCQVVGPIGSNISNNGTLTGTITTTGPLPHTHIIQTSFGWLSPQIDIFDRVNKALKDDYQVSVIHYAKYNPDKTSSSNEKGDVIRFIQWDVGAETVILEMFCNSKHVFIRDFFNAFLTLDDPIKLRSLINFELRRIIDFLRAHPSDIEYPDIIENLDILDNYTFKYAEIDDPAYKNASITGMFGSGFVWGESVEAELTKVLAAEICAEIDAEIVDTIMQSAKNAV